MSNLSNNEKNIVLRNRNICVLKKHLVTKKNMVILKNLVNESLITDTIISRIESLKKIFDFIVLECVNDYYFRNLSLLTIITNKLNEAALVESFGCELAKKYMCAIFPRSARIEYLLLRAKTNQIQFVKKKKNECSYVKWACCYSPSRTFRNIMDFIGSDYHYKL
jgi:hypothetical protein